MGSGARYRGESRYKTVNSLVLGSELRATGAAFLTGAATAATYDGATGIGTASRVDGTNRSSVRFAALGVGNTYLVSVTNTSGVAVVFLRDGAGVGTGTVAPGVTSFFRVTSGAGGTVDVECGTNASTANFTVNSIRQVLAG